MTYKSVKLTRLPYNAGMVPVKLFADARLQKKQFIVNNAKMLTLQINVLLNEQNKNKGNLTIFLSESNDQYLEEAVLQANCLPRLC